MTVYYDQLHDFAGNSYEFELPVEILTNFDKIIWDKSRFNDDFLDLKDFSLFFKFKNLNDLEIIASEQYKKFKLEQSRIRSWLQSFSCVGERNFRALPKLIYENFLSSRADLFISSLEYIRNFHIFNSFLQYYERNSRIFYCQKQMNYQILTKDGIEQVNLEFAENFRFKSSPKTLNLFHMPKVLRKKIIPQDDNSIIVSIDFRQFEFRTFLHLINFDIDFSCSNLYKKLGDFLRLTESDFKLKLISYLYSSSDELKIFNKHKILDRIENDSFCWNGIPVYVGNVLEKKKIHTIVQTISYFYYLDRLSIILNLLNGKLSKFIFPLHDELIFSIHKKEIDLIEEISFILENDVYKTKISIGENFGNMRALI